MLQTARPGLIVFFDLNVRSKEIFYFFGSKTELMCLKKNLNRKTQKKIQREIAFPSFNFFQHLALQQRKKQKTQAKKKKKK